MSEPKPGALSRLKQSGSVAWMARNPVAANVLMFILLIGGALMSTTRATSRIISKTSDSLPPAIPSST